MAKRKSTKVEQLQFEEAIEQLEQLIEQIESGQIGLEDSLKQYQLGTALIKRCRAIIDTAEKQIAELTISDGDDLKQVEDDSGGS